MPKSKITLSQLESFLLKAADCTVPQKLDTKIMFLIERLGLNYLFARAIGLRTPPA